MAFLLRLRGSLVPCGRAIPHLLPRRFAASGGGKPTVRPPSSVAKSEDEWLQSLNREEFLILRQKGTERPFSGAYDKFYPKAGYFACRGCGNPLYSAAAKFNSGCGWPAFDKCYEGAIKAEVDTSHGMRRVEIMCAACSGHLGHVFEGEGWSDTNERHCVNSMSVQFVEGEAPSVAETPVTK
eukprot:GGOE01014353.1.p2 GENE.GGOE01014353.1~~GGOE01014353.1.p2  ORF type:complete len:182 (-),score=45.97 GGOE01014353.1:282-827(-)